MSSIQLKNGKVEEKRYATGQKSEGGHVPAEKREGVGRRSKVENHTYGVVVIRKELVQDINLNESLSKLQLDKEKKNIMKHRDHPNKLKEKGSTGKAGGGEKKDL